MEEEARDPPLSPPPNYHAEAPPPEYWERLRRDHEVQAAIGQWLEDRRLGNPRRPGPYAPVRRLPPVLAKRHSRGRMLLISIILLSFFLYAIDTYYENQYYVCNASYEAIRTRLRAFYHRLDPLWKVWTHGHRVPDIYYPCTYFAGKVLTFYRHFVITPDNFRAGRWYTLLTSTFMNLSVWNLLNNIWDLWFWGTPFIIGYGIRHFCTLYVLGGIGGGLLRLYLDMLNQDTGGFSPSFAVGNPDSMAALMVVLALTVPLYTIPLFYVPILGASSLGIMGCGFLYNLGAFLGFWGVGVAHGHLVGYIMGLLYWVFVLKGYRFWDINAMYI